MKNLTPLFILFVLLGCSAPPKETPSIAGAYNMLKQSTTTSENEPVTNENIQQLKIYTANFVMYVHFNRNDSTASFGIGTYTAEPGGLTENMIYSALDSVINESGGNYKLEVEMSSQGYTQVIQDMDTNGEKVKLTETYESVGQAITSPLDGAWKQTMTYNIVDGDTTSFPFTQYKAFYAGHFMYGHTFRDATNKAHTGMGFGTFKMLGDNAVQEAVTVSTYGTGNRTFDIDIVFNGPDEFTQTITDDAGVNVEIYKRLKK